MTGRSSKWAGFTDEQSRVLGALDEKIERLTRELNTPDRVTDHRGTQGVIRPRPGDVVRVRAGGTVVLPHPRTAKGRDPIVVLVEGQPVSVRAESGTVNGVVSVTITTLGAMEWWSTGTEWWSTAVGGSTGGGGGGGLEDIAPERVLGNDSGVVGPPAPITVHQELDWVGGQTQWLFDGVDDRIEVGDVHDVERTDPFTISAWVQTPSSSAQQVIAGKLQASPSFRGWELGIEAPGKLYLILCSNFATTDLINVQTANNTVPVGGLVHVIVAYDGSGLATGISASVDGTAVAIPELGPSFGDVAGTTLSTQALELGVRAATNTIPFAGAIRHFAIWDAALSATQQAETYNGGTFPDLNALPTAPAPVLWYRLNANDATGAGGIIDYGSDGNDGTAAGGLSPVEPMGSLLVRSSALWQAISPSIDGLPFCSNGPGLVPSYRTITDSAIAAGAAIDPAKLGALTGDVTKASGSAVTAIGTGVIVNADVNNAAAIAQTKLGATTGFSVKASGASATTSAEPIITYSASSNMSAERVATSTTTIAVDLGTAGQARWDVSSITSSHVLTALGGVQSITGATTQDQVDSLVAAGVALGLWTDDR